MAPRRATPRLRVAAGSVGIAGRQTGIYPRDCPGGWAIVGRTNAVLFDPSRDAGRARAAGRPRAVRARGSPGADAAGRARRCRRHDAVPSVTVIRPGLLTTVQDAGRWGHQALGVPVGGALDARARRAANDAVGNGADAAAARSDAGGVRAAVRSPVHGRRVGRRPRRRTRWRAAGARHGRCMPRRGVAPVRGAPRRARAPMWRWPAAWTCRRCSAAARRSSARASADSAAARCGPAIGWPLDDRRGIGGAAARADAPSARRVTRRHGCACCPGPTTTGSMAPRWRASSAPGSP